MPTQSEITIPEVPMTLEAIEAWLRTLPSDTTFKCVDACHCPVAEYVTAELHARGCHLVSVCVTSIEVAINSRRPPYDLARLWPNPPEIAALVKEIDALDNANDNPTMSVRVSLAELHEIIDNIMGMR
jgi:hypothetical protein